MMSYLKQSQEIIFSQFGYLLQISWQAVALLASPKCVLKLLIITFILCYISLSANMLFALIFSSG